MTSILYIQLGENQIPELELYQIFLKLSKQIKDDKNLIIAQLEGNKLESCKLNLIKKDPNPKLTVDGLIEEKIDCGDSLHSTLKSLEKDNLVYILLSNLGQVKLVGNLVDELITIKKEELVRPL